MNWGWIVVWKTPFSQVLIFPLVFWSVGFMDLDQGNLPWVLDFQKPAWDGKVDAWWVYLRYASTHSGASKRFLCLTRLKDGEVTSTCLAKACANTSKKVYRNAISSLQMGVPPFDTWNLTWTGEGFGMGIGTKAKGMDPRSWKSFKHGWSLALLQGQKKTGKESASNKDFPKAGHLRCRMVTLAEPWYLTTLH